MNLTVLKQCESPLAALWQTPNMPLGLFFLSEGLCLCLPHGPDGRVVQRRLSFWRSRRSSLRISSRDQRVLAHFFCSDSVRPDYQLCGGPRSQPLDLRRPLVLPKLCPPSTKLWAPKPALTWKTPVRFLHMDLAQFL